MRNHVATRTRTTTLKFRRANRDKKEPFRKIDKMSGIFAVKSNIPALIFSDPTPTFEMIIKNIKKISKVSSPE